MNKNLFKIKADAIRWRQFTRKSDAVFLSLGKEICIGTLSAVTLLCVTTQTASAQTATTVSVGSEREMEVDEIEVTASRVPLPMNQAARIVSVITHEQIKECPAQTVNDLLKFAAGVDVRQRGAFGIQTDISINGGTHDQIVILLNGVNISNPHTGHLAADFPISTDDIERIEILEGAASRVYGTSAFSGAINIVTKKGTKKEASISVNGGSFGTVGADASISLSDKGIYSNISGGYMQSDGGTPNSDFQKYRAFYNGGTSLECADVNWQLGMSGQNYGANTFYSGAYPNQYEENRRYMGAISAKTKGKIIFIPTLYWTRNMDHYQLVRDTHTGENFHMTDLYGISAKAQTTWRLGTTSFGADLRNEGILSTALGKPLDEKLYVDIPGHSGKYTKRDNRTNICYFLEHDILLEKWTISAGVMANMNTALDYRYRLYPGVDISFRPTYGVNLYASWNMAQRMPTFTDLYYKNPTQEGNLGLKPEKTNEWAIGAKYGTKGFRGEIKGFYRKNTNIDWVLYPSDSVNNYTTYHAANLKMDNMGVSVNAQVKFRELYGTSSYLNTFTVNYAYLHQKRNDEVDIYASCYAMEYLRHKLIMSIDSKIWKRLTGTLSYRWQERTGHFIKYTPGKPTTTQDYKPYGLIDLKLQWTHPKYEVYLEGNNLTSYRYYDYGNVLQPGFWLMAGAKLRISL